jgi:putative AdoMet-dependent methyltransferase
MTELFGCHNAQADSYDDRVSKNAQQPGNYLRENYFAILDRVIELCASRPGMRVLDIGIGTGLLAERMPVSIELHGVDISVRMLAKLRGKELPAVLQQADFLHLPYGARHFDLVVTTFAFHHVTQEDKQGALAEMDRVLRPDGSLIIADLMFENDAQKNEMVSKFRDERRDDMLEEINDEYFTDISTAATILRTFGYEMQYERGSTITWILSATKIRHPG